MLLVRWYENTIAHLEDCLYRHRKLDRYIEYILCMHAIGGIADCNYTGQAGSAGQGCGPGNIEVCYNYDS